MDEVMFVTKGYSHYTLQFIYICVFVFVGINNNNNKKLPGTRKIFHQIKNNNNSKNTRFIAPRTRCVYIYFQRIIIIFFLSKYYCLHKIHTSMCSHMSTYTHMLLPY